MAPSAPEGAPRCARCRPVRRPRLVQKNCTIAAQRRRDAHCVLAACQRDRRRIVHGALANGLHTLALAGSARGAQLARAPWSHLRRA